MSRTSNTHEAIVSENAAVYNDYYASGIIDAWEDHDKKYNFLNLFKIAKMAKKPLRGSSVLDVGCGTGDIIPYLYQEGVKKYLGVDIYKPAITLAKHKYPEERFLLKNILEDKSLQKFDFVFCSGALSVKLKSIDNYAFLLAMVERMGKLSKFGLSFNVLTDEDADQAPELFYYKIAKLRKICKGVAKDARVVLRRTPIKNKGYADEAQIHVYLYNPYVSS